MKLASLLYISLLQLAVLPSVTAAACDEGDNALCNPIEFGTLTEVLTAILDVLVIFAIPIVVFFIIYAGFKYVVAQGNPSDIQEANRALTYALIGGIIILGATIITGVIENTVNNLLD